MTVARVLKYLLGGLVFLTLPTLLLYAFLYLKYNEELPKGKSGPEADAMANKMLAALNHQKFIDTDTIEFTFKNRHKFVWYKSSNQSDVYWKNYRVLLNLDVPSQSEAFKKEERLNGESESDAIEKALQLFNNDSFWLVAPYKVFDPGTTRQLVQTDDEGEALLVTYTSGGSTPGDSYLWYVDDEYIPTSYKMWVSILPIDGLEATWEGWITTESGALLPTFHKLLIMGIELTDVTAR